MNTLSSLQNEIFMVCNAYLWSVTVLYTGQSGFNVLLSDIALIIAGFFMTGPVMDRVHLTDLRNFILTILVINFLGHVVVMIAIVGYSPIEFIYYIIGNAYLLVVVGISYYLNEKADFTFENNLTNRFILTILAAIPVLIFLLLAF